MRSRPESGPPPAPEIPRSIRFTALQRVGIPILFGIPILALFGVLGERYTVQSAQGSDATVRIEYPTLIHFRQSLSLHIQVTNDAPRAADTIIVSLDPQ